ncbi:MAG: alkaline phosphatase family protein [Acidobacteria bacterium]|nr:alkaline phosphatase family protein [Acidobacteriota bacterium]
MIFPLAYVGPGAGFAFLGSFLTIAAAAALSVVALLMWPFRVMWRLAAGIRSHRKARVRKLIFLGLDGLDPRLTERFMAEGKMPNLARLKSQGSYSRLRTTFPALSPVAWSTFATGVNPARHNIFDFLNRDLRSYLPELSSSKVHPPRRFWKIGRYRIPLDRPWAELRRKSQPFWKILGEHRVGCTILRIPITFPPEKFDGRLLSAMCTPDLKGTQGSFSHFTTRGEAAACTGGSRFPLESAGQDLAGLLEGPENLFVADGGPLRIPFRVSPGLALRIQGRSWQLKAGEFSPWIRLTFRTPLGMRAHGIARFLITETTPEFSIYVTPVHIDPEKPALPISHPPYYAVYLAKLMGSFATLGMAEDTWALNEGVIDEKQFLEQTYLTHAERETMFLNALDRTRRGVVACVFDATDRVQHMFYRRLGENGGGAIEDLYRRADALVGKTLPHVDEQTVLFVLSDHGFASFRRGVNLNTWLHRNGYLALRDGACESGTYFQGVDWSRTKAYALGLGGVYLNLRGRESEGIVERGPEAAALEQELVGKLSNMQDDELGRTAIRRAYATKSLYQGPYLDAGPDLIIGFAEGYRTSWDAATGKVGCNVIEDNLKAWSGDHCIDPPLVPGVLFSNRKIDSGDPGLEDLAPTALELFGIRKPEWMEGKPVFRFA